MLTIEKPRSLSVTPKTAAMLIDAAGNGDATVIQTGLDQFGDDYAAWIKAGTYAAGFTEASSQVRIFIEAGTIIQAAITLSGNDITLIIGAGADIQGRITLSGNNCKLYCMNGVDIDGISITGSKCLVDGGGWDTLSNGGTAVDGLNIASVADDNIVRNMAFQTTAGGASAFVAISSEGARTSITACKIVDSDSHAISTGGNFVDSLIEGCVILGADGRGIRVNGPRNRIIGNYVIATGSIGIELTATGDNSVVVGNIVQDPTGDPIDIDADAENCVVVGNRTDGAVDDNSGTSTVGGNDEATF